MSALPGTPAIQNAIPMPFFGTTPFAAPGLGIIASAIMLGFGLWWLRRAEARPAQPARASASTTASAEDEAADDEFVRERATTAREFDPAEIHHGQPRRRRAADRRRRASARRRRRRESPDVAGRAAAARPVVPGRGALGRDILAAVGGVWSVVVALAAAIARR